MTTVDEVPSLRDSFNTTGTVDPIATSVATEENPEPLTVTWYGLRGMFEKLYRPALSVVLLRLKPLTGLTSVTMTPGTMAPEGSVITPESVPALPADCAESAEKHENKDTDATNTLRLEDVCMHYPLS